MTPRQIDLVQESWEKVVPIADDAAALFYARLFELDPSVKSMFRTDLKEQGRKLMQMLTMIVRGLKTPEEIAPAIQASGRRHVGYGVTEAHYDTVGAALLWTLERGLGEDEFTPEAREAWTAAYGRVAGLMKEAAVGLTPSSGT